jgi:hypothetical protein
MNSTTELPYELHTPDSGAFVIFNVTEQIALPLIALARATWRRTETHEVLTLEFANMDVTIEGSALGGLVDHLLAGRVKRISCAQNSGCKVAAIRLVESYSDARDLHAAGR